MRVRVDSSRCQGHTLCAMIAPESFVLDDVDGQASAVAHASVHTPPDSPDAARVRELYMAMGVDLYTSFIEIRDNPRPGIVDALAKLRIEGDAPPDIELVGMLNLLIGGGFDTTTALTAHALEWLSQHPDERVLLSTPTCSMTPMK